MRKIDKLIDIDEATFKRVVGVKYSTFKVMIEEYQKAEIKRKKDHKIGGRRPKLCEEDRVLFMLEYYREYRTFKHLGVDYGVSESSAHYIVTKIEKILIQEPKFHLKSLKHSVPTTNNDNIDVVVVDITESQCERPKKSKDYTIQERKKDIH